MNKVVVSYIIISFSFLLANNLLSQDNNAVIISQTTIDSSDFISIVVNIMDAQNEINPLVTGKYLIEALNADLEIDSISIYRGVGTVSTSISANNEVTLSILGFNGEKDIHASEDRPIINVGTEINESTTWDGNHIYRLKTDLVVLEDCSLTIMEGSVISLSNKSNIIVHGQINVQGSKNNPVIFKPDNPTLPWGGIMLTNNADSSMIEYAFFVFGGADDTQSFGHSESQPVIMADHTKLHMNNCFLLDNIGKAVGGDNSKIVLDNSVISRCDTGGEYHWCYVSMNNSYFIDIPDDDVEIEDDDNDGSYFYNSHPGYLLPSKINNCIFINGEDDGIDHNEAKLQINNCWIENFYHEGIAGSGSNSLNVYNTMVKNCEQGIEAGYGSPMVNIDHCVLIDNMVGLRFGDSYDWGCDGHIIATNTILFNNDDNIKNFDLLSGSAVEGAIEISYSMTNDVDYNSEPYCISGIPIFDENYFLQEDSPGYGEGMNNDDMGLTDKSLVIENVDLWITDLNLFPVPIIDDINIRFYLVENSRINISIYNYLGQEQFNRNFNYCNVGINNYVIDSNSFSNGLLIVKFKTDKNQSFTIKVIKVEL